MTSNDRVKILRKELGLTLEKFGERVGVGKTAISNIENGNRGLTDQMIRSICREFNVDYIWLTKGEGQMFANSDSSFYELVDRIMAGENELHKNFFKTMCLLSEDELSALESIIDKFLEVSKKKED